MNLMKETTEKIVENTHFMIASLLSIYMGYWVFVAAINKVGALEWGCIFTILTFVELYFFYSIYLFTRIEEKEKEETKDII